MKPKTTVVLIVVLALLVGYVALRESGLFAPAPPPETPAPKKLLTVDAGNLKRIVVASPGSADIVLARDGQTWRLDEPLKARADAGKVDSLAYSLRTLAGSPVDPGTPNTGMDHPAFTVTLTDQKDASQTLLFGREAPRIGSEIQWYVSVQGGKDAYKANGDFAETFAVSPEELRDKKLLDVTGDVVDVQIDRVGGTVQLTKVAAEWMVRTPLEPPGETEIVTSRQAQGPSVEGKADEPAVRRLIDKLKALRAQRFVAGGAADTRRAQQARATLTMTLADKTQLSLVVGSPGPGTDLTYVTVGKEQPVLALVRSADADALLADGAAYWDPTIIKLPPYTTVTRLSVTKDGKTIEAERRDEAWRRAASQPGDAEIDSAAAKTAADQLASITASRLVCVAQAPPDKYAKAPGLVRVAFRARTEPPASAPATSSGPASSPASSSAPASASEPASATAPAESTGVAAAESQPSTAPASAPTSAPRAVIVTDYGLCAVKIGDKAYAWLNGGKAVAVGEVPASVYDALAADLRSKKVWKFQPEEVTDVKVTGAESFELVKTDGKWTAKSDPSFAADYLKIDSFLTALASLAADRFVTADETADAGADMARPAITIEIQTGDRTLTLKLSSAGTETGGRYATASSLNDTFVLTPAAVNAIKKPLKDLGK